MARGVSTGSAPCDPGAMTATADVLNHVIPALVRLARRPGAALLVLAAVTVGSFAVLGLVHGLTESSGSAWIPLVLAGVLAVPVVVLAVRRRRLQHQVAQVRPRTTIAGNAGVVVRSSERGAGWDSERETLSAAMAENALRTARFLPRVEAAQRAARLAAGGPVVAPYLKDDIRVTLVALLATLAAIPLAGLGIVLTAVLLLTG